MFRVITRKLVERKNKKRQENLQDRNNISSRRRAQGGYFEGSSDVQGSFRLINKRQSWLGITSAPGIASGDETDHGVQSLVRDSKGRCC